MTSMEAKNAMLRTVLIDLAGICKKLVANPVVPENLRRRAHELVTDFHALLPYSVSDDAQHAEGEKLIIQITRFLPELLKGQARAATGRM